MVEQHSKDYKLTAVKYYLTHNKTMRDVCNKIFNCKIQSLSRWKIKYNKEGNIKRKNREHKNTKITPEIISFIKDYVKYNPIFNLEEMVAVANKEARSKNLGKFSETDIIWVASNLIREKSVQTRKFVEPVIQKNLSHMLPDIMRRQWSGKMGPILQVLEEREETKNVTAIDLAVWMVQNNFE